MSVIQSGLFLIMQRFPQHRTVLRDMYHQNNDFRVLCEDYQECAQALKFWVNSERNESAARSREYSHLLQDLEREIRRSLDAFHGTGSSH